MCGGCRGKSENRTPEGPQGTSITGGDSARHVCNPRAWKGRSEDWVTLSREGGSGGKESPAMWKTRVQSVCQEGPLEKGTANHSSVLAWRIPWTEEPGGLQSREGRQPS